MTHLSKPKKALLVVQIIALMICTLTCHLSWSAAEETTTAPTEETVPSTETTTTTAPAESEDEGLTAEDIASVEALQQQRTELQRQALELQEARQYYTDSLEGLLQQKNNIEEQISLKQREIDINHKLQESITIQINITDEQLMQQEQALLVRRQAILERFEAMRQKLRALSKGGDLSALQILAGSDNYTDYLINSKMAKRLAAIDEEIINGLEDELVAINTQRELLIRQQQQLEAEREPFVAAAQTLEGSKRELLALLEEANTISEQLNSNLTYYRQEYLTVSQQQSQLQQQINAILKDHTDIENIAPSVMFWPAPECTVITSSFKPRWNSFHNGLDIAAWGDSSGKSIVAAADGTVVFAGEDSSGFGKYIMIDHGYDILNRRIITLYGHCSALYVQEGDVVFGGQTVIAAVGNTGNSNGAHLHFEVRVDGNAVDPVGEGFLATNGITITG